MHRGSGSPERMAGFGQELESVACLLKATESQVDQAELLLGIGLGWTQPESRLEGARGTVQVARLERIAAEADQGVRVGRFSFQVVEISFLRFTEPSQPC